MKQVKKKAKVTVKPGSIGALEEFTVAIDKDLHKLELAVDSIRLDLGGTEGRLNYRISNGEDRILSCENAIGILNKASNEFASAQANKIKLLFLFNVLTVLAITMLITFLSFNANAADFKTVAECKTECSKVLDKASEVIGIQQETLNYMGKRIMQQTSDMDLMIAELDGTQRKLEAVESSPLHNPWILIPLGFITGYITSEYLNK